MKLRTKKIIALSSILTVFAMMFCFSANAQFNAGNAKPSELNISQETDFKNILTTVSKAVLGIMAGLAVLIFIIAGIIYIVSGAKPEWQDMARNFVQFAIIGLIVALLGFVILSFISRTVGVQ